MLVPLTWLGVPACPLPRTPFGGRTVFRQTGPRIRPYERIFEERCKRGGGAGALSGEDTRSPSEGIVQPTAPTPALFIECAFGMECVCGDGRQPDGRVRHPASLSRGAALTGGAGRMGGAEVFVAGSVTRPDSVGAPALRGMVRTGALSGEDPEGRGPRSEVRGYGLKKDAD